MFVSILLVIGLTPRHQPSAFSQLWVESQPSPSFLYIRLLSLPSCAHYLSAIASTRQAHPHPPSPTVCLETSPSCHGLSPTYLFFHFLLQLGCFISLSLSLSCSVSSSFPMAPPTSWTSLSCLLTPPPQLQPRAPSPDTIDEFSLNPKQAYKAFAAVPHSLAMLEPPLQVGRLPRPCTPWVPTSMLW